MDIKMEWADKVEGGGDGYFKIQEGDNRVQLLTHCAPYKLKWTGARYEPAEEGDENISVKGVCWVLHDGVVKSATLPYTIIKSIRQLMTDEDYAFSDWPMPRMINIRAIGAGTKEVEYSVIPSPKETPVAPEVLEQLIAKPTPEEMVEKMRSAESRRVSDEKPAEDIRDIPDSAFGSPGKGENGDYSGMD